MLVEIAGYGAGGVDGTAALVVGGEVAAKF